MKLKENGGESSITSVYQNKLQTLRILALQISHFKLPYLMSSNLLEFSFAIKKVHLLNHKNHKKVKFLILINSQKVIGGEQRELALFAKGP